MKMRWAAAVLLGCLCLPWVSGCCTSAGVFLGKLADEHGAAERPAQPCDALEIPAGTSVILEMTGGERLRGLFLGRDCSADPHLMLLRPGRAWGLPGAEVTRDDTLMVPLRGVESMKVLGNGGRTAGLVTGLALDTSLAVILVQYARGLAGVGAIR